MTPSKIKKILPMGSTFKKMELELTCQNFAIILARTTDTFRLLPRKEYEAEMMKDGWTKKNMYPWNKDIAWYFEDANRVATIATQYKKGLGL